MVTASRFVIESLSLYICSLGIAILGYMGYHAVRRIINKCQSTEKVELVAKNNINYPDPKAHKLAAKIGLNEIPSDPFSIIYENLIKNNLALDPLNNIKITSHHMLDQTNTYINRIINEEKLSLAAVGCKTGSEAVDYIIKNQLLSANLSDFPDITEDDLTKLIVNCPNLQALFITSSKITKAPIEKLTALRSLNLSGCPQLEEDKLAEALPKLTALTSLNLSHCPQLTEDKLAEALPKLTALTSLDLSGCWLLTGDKLAEALPKLTALTSLNLSGCPQLEEDKLAEALPKLTALTSLDLSGCWLLTGDKLAEALAKLTALRSLGLCGWNLKEDKLAEALPKLTALTSLDLSWCEELTGDKLAEALPKLTALTSLNFSMCHQLTGDKLPEALSKMTALRSLDLSWCVELTGDRLVGALLKLPALKRIDLAEGPQFTEDQIKLLNSHIETVIL